MKDPIAWKLIFFIFVQLLFVTMVYGPIAAYLVEAFPARIRYTALSLPYHIGNGVFGGLLPLIGLYVVSATGNIYAGLYYPIAVAAITFVVGSLSPEGNTRRKDLGRIALIASVSAFAASNLRRIESNESNAAILPVIRPLFITA